MSKSNARAPSLKCIYAAVCWRHELVLCQSRRGSAAKSAQNKKANKKNDTACKGTEDIPSNAQAIVQHNRSCLLGGLEGEPGKWAAVGMSKVETTLREEKYKPIGA